MAGRPLQDSAARAKLTPSTQPGPIPATHGGSHVPHPAIRFDRLCLAFRRGSSHRANRKRTEIPGSPDQAHRPRAAGWRCGHPEPGHRQQDGTEHGPARRGREQSRRERGDRHRGARQVAARRLHDHDGLLGACDQPHLLVEPAVRHEQGLLCDRARWLHPADPRRERGIAVQVGAGARRRRESEARAAAIRIRRRGRGSTPVGRAAEEHRRRGHRARSVQGQRAGPERPPGWARHDDVRHHHDRAAAREKRQAARPRRDQRRRARRWRRTFRR